MRTRDGFSVWLVALAVLFGGLAGPPARAAQATTASVDGSDVRLVVMIVVDGLRADLLTRCSRYFGEDGFKQLMSRSAYFPNAYYTYGPTCTAVGHATIGSGRLPRQHGIINNEWFLDPLATEKQQTVYDKDVKAVGLPDSKNAAGYSPRYLIGPALGDQMKLADRRSRIFSISLKHRAAVMIAGQNPDGVFWWDRATGKIVSSTWYMDALPAYIAEYNDGGWTDRFVGKIWDKLLPEEAYASCHPVEPSWIVKDYHLGAVFPHWAAKTAPDAPGKPYDSLYGSPFGNDIVLEITRRVLASEKLGRAPARDMLCVSFSANDVAGHIWGPDSPELLDITVRTDQQIAELLQLIQQQVGLNHCAIVLTGDHGVKELPQVAAAAGLGGKYLDVDALARELNGFLADEFGALDGDQPYVLGILPPWLWFNKSFGGWEPEKQVDVLYASAAYLSGIQGIAQVVTAVDLAGPPPLPSEPTRWLAWRSYYPGRSGEIYIHLQSHWQEIDDIGNTGHGSAHSSDRHVPILLAAPGVRPGRYMEVVDPLDIAPTLAAILGIEPPVDVSGRVLHEAFGGR